MLIHQLISHSGHPYHIIPAITAMPTNALGKCVGVEGQGKAMREGWKVFKEEEEMPLDGYESTLH